MIVASAKVGPFKSIDAPQTVAFDAAVTVLVGMNEAGKTVFLQAIEKSADVLGIAKFDPVDDYPRKDLSAYLGRHKAQPEEAVGLVYCLSDEEVDEVNAELHTQLKHGFSFGTTHKYDNSYSISIDVDERPVIRALLKSVQLSSDATAAVAKATSLRDVPAALKGTSLTDPDSAFLKEIEARIAKTKWESVVECEVWLWLEKRLPKVLYFGEYDLLPSKVNLAELRQRVEAAKSNPSSLASESRGILALLRMADIAIDDFARPGGYEPLKAKIEAVSISLTDQVLEFWKQNEDLEVEVDIKADQDDTAPFNNGPNLYLRIRNRRHRGVSTPFKQRSHGFIWFFSFLVWFDSVQHQLGTPGKTTDRKLVLLLDEPGLSLHASAQADFLRYIDRLSEKHQVVYTTHSPFMVHPDRLHQVRVVEDLKGIGTVISDTISSSDPRTILPLQAALGWTIAQNLFISERNLLVEGPADLVYLRAMSSKLEAVGRSGLREDITIVPTGGLDKVVTFVALLGANGLQLAVLHDYRGTPDQKLMDLVRAKLISPNAVLNVSQFRDPGNVGQAGPASDIEDLIDLDYYVGLFSRAYSKQLGGQPVKAGDLPEGERVVDRIERFLDSRGLKVRPSGGFNHYLVASHFASHPPATVTDATLGRFEALFSAVNKLFDTVRDK